MDTHQITEDKQELVISQEKTMFNMEWIFINGQCLCSVKDAKDAILTKRWKIDKWMKQAKLSKYERNEFEEALTTFLRKTGTLK